MTGKLRVQATQQRDAGLAAPLKKLHNRIKRLLIRRFAYDANSLLDLACGRGGDLHKWVDSDISFVRGYDIAAEEVWLFSTADLEKSQNARCKPFLISNRSEWPSCHIPF